MSSMAMIWLINENNQPVSGIDVCVNFKNGSNESSPYPIFKTDNSGYVQFNGNPGWAKVWIDDDKNFGHSFEVPSRLEVVVKQNDNGKWEAVNYRNR